MMRLNGGNLAPVACLEAIKELVKANKITAAVGDEYGRKILVFTPEQVENNSPIILLDEFGNEVSVPCNDLLDYRSEGEYFTPNYAGVSELKRLRNKKLLKGEECI